MVRRNLAGLEILFARFGRVKCLKYIYILAPIIDKMEETPLRAVARRIFCVDLTMADHEEQHQALQPTTTQQGRSVLV